MTAQKHVDGLVEKSCHVAVKYDEGTLIDVFFEEVASPIPNSLIHYCARNHQADLTDFAI